LKDNPLLQSFAVAQAALGARVFTRMARAASAQRIPASAEPLRPATLTAIVPVLNESSRVAGALGGLAMQGPWLREVLVVDGGSSDETVEIVRWFAARDPRIKPIAAPRRPPDWNGKIWNLKAGLEAADPGSDWILTLDADVRPTAQLTASLLSFAQAESLDALSLATRQDVSGDGLALLHGSMLATLIYRFGPPGSRATSPAGVMANGQCFLARRAVLERTHAFESARDSRCEDVTIARTVVSHGFSAGFYEADGLAGVRMYESAGEAWANWPRSLPLNDRYVTAPALALQLAEVLLVQALPPAIAAAGLLAPGLRSTLLYRVNLALALARLGVLAGASRAYANAPAGYWLSPLADLAVALRLAGAACQRDWTWRGVELVNDAK
jgi:dolichol-phosphate mannosyltransferase